MPGRSVEELAAPLFVAWQLTNRCGGRCIACCEDSGPDRAWADELSREQALGIARQIADAGIPYVAFGGGEPLSVPHCWELFEQLSAAGVALKLETDGGSIDEAAADRLLACSFHCIQISIDGASAATHERMRPGTRFEAALAGIGRLRARGAAPDWVFVPTRFNLHEITAAYERAAALGCSAFVTGPLMRLGRAARDWEQIACSEAQWQRAVDRLEQRARELASRTRLSIYPWDIPGELEQRLRHPQAMLLIVPDGQVKLLNALPFAAADLRHDTLAAAWQAYRQAWRSREVGEFIAACRADPGLLGHANETWTVGATTGAAP